MKNKHIKLFEEFNDDVDTAVIEVLDKIETMFKSWFDNGMLSKEDIKLESTNTNTETTDPTIEIEFSNEDHMFSIDFFIDYAAISADRDDVKLEMEFKKYDNATSELVSTLEDEITMQDLTEDYILSKISEAQTD
jgi:hypothetical protein